MPRALAWRYRQDPSQSNDSISFLGLLMSTSDLTTTDRDRAYHFTYPSIHPSDIISYPISYILAPLEHISSMSFSSSQSPKLRTYELCDVRCAMCDVRCVMCVLPTSPPSQVPSLPSRQAETKSCARLPLKFQVQILSIPLLGATSGFLRNPCLICLKHVAAPPAISTPTPTISAFQKWPARHSTLDRSTASSKSASEVRVVYNHPCLIDSEPLLQLFLFCLASSQLHTPRHAGPLPICLYPLLPQAPNGHVHTLDKRPLYALRSQHEQPQRSPRVGLDAHLVLLRGVS